MGIITMLTVSVAAVALLTYAMSEKQRQPIRKEVRIEKDEHDPFRSRTRHD
ncbi:hypothetical protein [Halomonas alkalisoli]|uniref:hypothetical protein n=1 Tax=Halomonas alkalisoli TaxID=2907158 RepID=UPI001F19D906|nr:hypothetical protein [Halomonas alkalisoli]MCE9681923.1 hypothetical protein [Halomonas alkalisoli]